MAPPLKGSPGRLPVWRHDLRIRHRKHPDVFATKRDVVKSLLSNLKDLKEVEVFLGGEEWGEILTFSHMSL